MVVAVNKSNQTNAQNPTIDTGQVTVNAFNVLRNKQASDKNFILGRDDKLGSSPVHKVKVKAWTQDDDQTHTYFHSLSIDVQVEDFMGTAELKCPYDSDLMEYWEPIRQTVVIYGANKGDYKILFIGRVRELKQDGYELVISFQNYGWKFKQLVTQSYAKDNVLNKNGYTIMTLMFEALKIDSYVISESAKKRLKEVGINEDGNVTLNGEEIEEMPDLIERLKASNPSDVMTKDTLNNKLREKYLHNIKDINYTLKYEEPTPVMKEIASQGGGYSSGSNVYANAYGSASSSGGGGARSGGSSASGKNCSPPNFRTSCPQVGSEAMRGHMATIWKFNRACVNDFSGAKSAIVNFANNSPASYTSQVKPCLTTLSKYSTRSDKRNAASEILNEANNKATVSGATKAVSGAVNYVTNALNNIGNAIHQAATNIYNGIKSFLGF